MREDPDASVALRRTILKGKSGRRGWARLPKEILHLIISSFASDTFNLELPSAYHLLASSSKMMFNWLRVASYLQPLMSVCRQWRIALTDHNAWSRICGVLDQHREISSWLKKTGGRSAQQVKEMDWEHYRILRMFICVPCRIMSPAAIVGYGAIKHKCYTMENGVIGLCHWHEPDRICGNCLRADVPQDEYTTLCISKNEDNTSFPYIEATCITCRKDALYKVAMRDITLQAALRDFNSERDHVDWEVRQTVDSYFEFGSVTTMTVLSTVWERSWLRKCTKLVEFLEQAVASVRYENREEGYDTDDEISEDEDVMCIQEDAGVRDIAISEYCRCRILDGNWTSPYDAYTSLLNRWVIPVTLAKHPLPYMQKPGEAHPTAEHGNDFPPPTQYLAETLLVAYTNEMRKVLAPALNNLVRKISLGCIRERVDPSIGASKLTIQDIIEGLRDEGVWWDNYNWEARWEKDAREAKVLGRHLRDEEESNSSSDGSLPSHQTSPVLSTTTLQTTPSPPPVEGETGEKKLKAGSELHPSKEATMLRYIPLVPESLDSMPRHSQDTLIRLWREAASVLYHCRCSVCVRAMRTEKANSAAAIAAEVATSATFSDSVLTSDDFDEEDLDLQDAIAYERKLNPHIIVPEYDESQQRMRREDVHVQRESRKRSSEELEDANEYEEEDHGLESHGQRDTYSPNERVWFTRRESPTSMKRIRLSEEPALISTPTRKRSSEEMECADGEKTAANVPDIKKVRAEE